MRSAILALVLTVSLSGEAAPQRKSENLLVVLTVGRNGPALFIDRNLEKSGTYYDAIAKYFRAPGGKERQVVLYVSDELPYYNFDGMIGELQAVGYGHIRTFAFSRETKRGTEITKIGQAAEVPFEIR